MKRLPLKWKLTLLYTFFMMLLTAGMLGILFSLSSGAVASSVRKDLEESVWDAFDEIEWEDGELEIDSDLMEVEDGIYLAVYDEKGKRLGGRIPQDVEEEAEVTEGFQKVSAEHRQWYTFGASAEIEDYGNIFIQGMISVSRAETSLHVTLRLSVILFPMMVCLTAALGYFFISRTLRPVAKITQTAREIYERGDLSKRITAGQDKKSAEDRVCGGVKPPHSEKKAKKTKRNEERRKGDEIDKLAETFDLMLDRLQTAFEKEKQFTSDVSHELRTPVTVILAQCDALLAEENCSGEERKAVEVIRNKAQNMANMIAQLLFLARADQKRMAVHKERLDLSVLTEIAVEEQREIAKKKEMQIRTDIPDPVDGYADETLWIRLWMNLIGNAVTYGREGGWVQVGLKREAELIKGYVRDNGIGIPQEHLPHIWERFYQVDSARSSGEISGSGLGLPMVRWIVEAHGGSITVESVQGEGTTFSFVFPSQ